MIKRIKIHNFQCHEKKNLLLENGRTITGTSNSGKSAIIRALYWVCCNKPRGNAFITHGKKACLVSIEGDGYTLTRKRGKANQYIFNGEIYETIGNEIPEIIQNALGINPEITFQLQHDAPFLLAKSPNESGAFVSGLAKLNQMQDCLFALKKKIQAEQDKFRLLESERAKAIEAGKQAQEVLKIKPVFDICMGYEQRLEKNADTITRLESLLKAIVLTQDDPVISFDFEEAIACAGKHMELTKDCEKWKAHVGRLDNVLSEYNRIKSLIDPFPMDHTEDLENACEMQKQQNTLQALTDKWESIRKTVYQYTDKILGLKESLKGKVCPLCQSQLQ